jgi:hypothetical protein
MRTLKDIFVVLSAAAIAVLIDYYVLEGRAVETVLNSPATPPVPPIIGH